MFNFLTIILPGALSIIFWFLLLNATNQMSILLFAILVIAGVIPIINLLSFLTFIVYVVFSSDYTIDYNTRSGRIIKFFTKKR